MKWLWVVILLVVGIGLFLPGWIIQKRSSPTASQHFQKPTTLPSITKPTDIQQSIFVPYWGLNSSLSTTAYNSYIYFGITPDENGIDTSDGGFKKIQQFLNDIPTNSKTLLTLTMTNSGDNEKILSDPALQQKIIDQTIQIAKQNGFNGIVLDLEYSALAFDSVVTRVSNFSTQFATAVKSNNLLFYQALAGDTFYRAKPYNVGLLGRNADGIFVMAYDFHKAKGNPGANFPLHKDSDAYDFEDMTTDFLKKVPLQKLTVVFGLFGYDWAVDTKGQSLQEAQSLSLKDIEQKFVDSCVFLQCQRKRDAISSETEVTYSDTVGTPHIVWFEDMQSIATKKTYLQKQGVSSMALWAYSYF